jgi:uncharacterized protein (DUF1684 family)
VEGSNAVNVIRFGWVTLLLVANLASAADEAYAAEILQWRKNFDADVRNGGWLTGIGNFEISLGTSTLGSGPRSTMRLPPLHAAKSIGKLIRHGNIVTFGPSRGIRAQIDGHAISKPQILSMNSGVGRVRVGSIEFRVRPFADRLYVFVDDLENPAVVAFAGNQWFPIDDSYRVSAKFVPYDKPAETRIPLTHIEWKQPMTSTGDVVFTLGGQNVRLKSFVDGDKLFIMFTDPTNGQDTYGGGRFIYAPLPKDGATTVDFNKAFNPYCSVNQYVYCPIPPAENRLDYRVAAGEQFQGHE